MRLLRSLLLGGALLASAASPAVAQLKVVTSTTDLWDIARQVGGNRATVKHISEGFQDPHFVEAKPSFVLDLQKADAFAYVGLQLEIGWAPVLLAGARNPKIAQGAPGDIDVSQAITLLDVPSGNVDRSQGDVHPLGNPHYWLDPENGRRIALLFRDRFTRLDPAGAATYDANAKAFIGRLDAAEKAWAPALARLKGKPVIAWHTSWRYFAEYTGLNIVGFMEPKPGVPPSPSHLAGLIMTAQRTSAKAIIMEPWYDRKTADLVASKTGAKVLLLPPSVGGQKGLDDYISTMRNAIESVAGVIQ
ncbi:MAG: periplasmic solute binding protein [Gemmatimonadetes bacterium]|nr:periplasmic solute binding protein [Gemmatimonadota bacterium]